MKPGETRPLTGKEMNMLEHLVLLDARMAQYSDNMRDRLGAVEHGWRDWKLVQVKVTRLVEELYKTLSRSHAMHFYLLHRYGEAHITERPVVHQKGYINISGDDLQTLLEIILRHECSMCMKEGKEVKKCKLRRLMLELAPPSQVDTHWCEYQKIVLNQGDAKEATP